MCPLHGKFHVYHINGPSTCTLFMEAFVSYLHVDMYCHYGHIMLMSTLYVEMCPMASNTEKAGSHQITIVPILLNTASTRESLEHNFL